MRIAFTFARTRRIALALVLLPLATSAAQKGKKKDPLDGFDAYVAKSMQEFRVPGTALAIVRNDSVLLLKGYGVRTLGDPAPVDSKTIFAIGSSSKAFTATSIAMMVDDAKMRWEDPVTKFLPSFQLWDSYATRDLTLRDALSHRSGLSRGDLSWYGSEYDRNEVLRRVRYNKPSWGFRGQFGYQNVMYLAAGQSLAAASGMTWDDFVKRRIFAPLGMTASNTSVKALAGQANVAQPHAIVDDTVRVIPWRDIDNIAPAGSINSNVEEMAHWVRFQLGDGKFEGTQLVSAGTLRETRMPNTPIRLEGLGGKISGGAHLQSYGMGWFTQDFRGRFLVQHGGNIDGMSAMVAFMPEEHLGVVVLTNMNGTLLRDALMYRAFDQLLSDAPSDWSGDFKKVIDEVLKQGKETEERLEKARVAGTSPTLALEKYAGRYLDSLYGDVVVSLDGGKLRIARGPTFHGTLEHWNYDAFRVTWDARTLGKTMMRFEVGSDGKVVALHTELEGPVDFRAMPPKADTKPAVALLAADLSKLTGKYAPENLPLTIEVQVVGDALKLTVPGQPAYTLVAITPTRFRMTGPPDMPDGFYFTFELANGAVTGATLEQPAPRPTLKLKRQG